MKKIFRITMTIFVAAAMFAASCTKDGNISEADIVGEWEFTDNRQNDNITINEDHTCQIGHRVLLWTLSGDTFKATQEVNSNKCEFRITEFNGNTMKVSGSLAFFGETSDYSGTLLRTTTVTPDGLKESDLLGTWGFRNPGNIDGEDEWTITIEADHAGKIDIWPATWSVSGNTLSIVNNDGVSYIDATVKTITTSATKKIMEVEGRKGFHYDWGDWESNFSGIFVKTI